MAQDLDTYSRVVGWLKVFLPIGGLAILSTLFLLARGEQYSDSEIMDSALAPSGAIEAVREPDYSGVTNDGTLVSITASAAWPHNEKSTKIEASDVMARFDEPDGRRAEVRADSGLLDGAVLALTGDVEVDVLPGWSMQTDKMDVWLDATRLQSDAEVRTDGPIGSIQADAMLITRDETAAGDAYLIEYVGAVRLVYQP